jgi:hypothetical protein
MWITTGRRGTTAALLGFAALAISGSAAGATKHGVGSSSAATSRAIAACNGMAHNFQSDVFLAATARGSREATMDVEWRDAASNAASLWLRSGCLSLSR